MRQGPYMSDCTVNCEQIEHPGGADANKVPAVQVSHTQPVEEVSMTREAPFQIRPDRSASPLGITRREILVTGGATLVTTLFTHASGAQTPGATTKNGGTKPVYVPA